jgi:hypothetical protein
MKENDKQNNALMLSGFSGDHAGEYPVLQCVGAFRLLPYSSLTHH